MWGVRVIRQFTYQSLGFLLVFQLEYFAREILAIQYRDSFLSGANQKSHLNTLWLLKQDMIKVTGRELKRKEAIDPSGVIPLKLQSEGFHYRGSLQPIQHNSLLQPFLKLGKNRNLPPSNSSYLFRPFKVKNIIC